MKESQKQRNRRYYIHRVLKRNEAIEVRAREKTINIPFDLDIQCYPKIKELQELHYNIQTTIN